MRLARKQVLIIGLIGLLTSCAQIGTISGGEKDFYAPKPDMEHASPPNKSVNFSDKQVVIPFDEYFTIQNPGTSIRMVPPHATIRSSFKGKKLILQWDEELKPNTTYSIFLDEAIRDITEGNDSLIQFVFSTGPQIDTLSYSGQVLDAWSKKPMKNVYAILRRDTDSSIVSYAQSDKSGFFNLTYMSEGNYTLLLIDESLKDLKLGSDEAVAFKGNSTLTLDQSVLDTVPFLLSTPKENALFKDVSVVKNDMVSVSATHKLDPNSFYMNHLPLDSSRVKMIRPDSAVVFIPATSLRADLNTLYYRGEQVDSASLRIKNIAETGSLTNKTREQKIIREEGVHLLFDAYIQHVDTAHIHLFNAVDSSVIDDFAIRYAHNDLQVFIPNIAVESIIIMIDSNTVQGEGIVNTSFEKRFAYYKDRELGTIVLKVNAFDKPLIVDVLNGNTAVERLYIDTPQEPLKLIGLLPGEYSFRVIEDLNQNGIWDTCDPKTFEQAERVLYFDSKNKLRANWEIDVELIPTAP